MAALTRPRLAAHTVGGAIVLALLAGSVWLFAQPRRGAARVPAPAAQPAE